jgi:hypothetical protein
MVYFKEELCLQTALAVVRVSSSSWVYRGCITQNKGRIETGLRATALVAESALEFPIAMVV